MYRRLDQLEGEVQSTKKSMMQEEDMLRQLLNWK